LICTHRWRVEDDRDGTKAVTLLIEPLKPERGFRLTGDLDLFSYKTLRDLLEPELNGTLIMDVGAVDFVDDSGLGTLVWSIKRLHNQGGSLVLRNPRSELLRVLDVTGLGNLPGLRIESEGEAL
jgi:anti-sigma B factor antagonist